MSSESQNYQHGKIILESLVMINNLQIFLQSFCDRKLPTAAMLLLPTAALYVAKKQHTEIKLWDKRRTNTQKHSVHEMNLGVSTLCDVQRQQRQQREG